MVWWLTTSLVLAVFTADALSLRVRGVMNRLFFLKASTASAQFPYLDSIRGFAALLVLGLHLVTWHAPHFDGMLPGFPFFFVGQKGVGIFFVLSAFLIWRSLQLSALAQYFRKRLWRILPLHIFISAIYYWNDVKSLSRLGPFLYEATLLPAVLTNDLTLKNPVAWSIVMEVQFYLLLPLVKYWYTRHRTSAVLFLGGLLTTFYLLEARGHQPWVGGAPCWYKYFVLGVLLSIAWESQPRWVRFFSTAGRSSLLFALSLIVLVLNFYGWNPDPLRLVLHPQPSDPAPFNITLALAVCGLVLALLQNAKLARLLSGRWLRIPGVVSYSLYLNQMLLIGYEVQHFSFPSTGKIGFLFLALFPFHLLLSALCFVLVERPFLAASRLRSRARP